MRKIVALILCISMLVSSIPYKVYADEAVPTQISEVDNANELVESVDKSAIITVTNKHTVNSILKQYKFSYRSGHGFAAEQGNNLIDRLKWNNAVVVGDDNVKNGPDRLIFNKDGSVKLLIQDKYWSTATQTIEDCYDDITGLFKYLDGEGNPMCIEVPKDQYEKAVEIMKRKISEGKVPGVTDPEEASNIVRQGRLTYKQAVNLSKPLTKESLLYDSGQGFVQAGVGFGISSVLTYIVLSYQGESHEDALKGAARQGLVSGGQIFTISVITGQLTKAGALSAFKPTSEALVKLLGEDFEKSLLESAGTPIIDESAESLTKQAARLLRSQLLVAAVTVFVIELPDFINLFRNRISFTQFLKNLISTIGTVGYSMLFSIEGAKIGTAISPGVGTVVGGVVGGLAGGIVSYIGIDWVLDKVFEDDAEEMYRIVSNRFSSLCEDYLVNEQEAQSIIDELNRMIDDSMLKDMYQSNNREAFIDAKLTPLFENVKSNRSEIEKPTEEEMRYALKDELKGVVFIH